jgi:uncharacterized protein YukE
MAGVEVSMSYEHMEAAAADFTNAAQQYREMLALIRQQGELLQTKGFLGGTGNRALNFANQLAQRLQAHAAQSDEMAKDIRYNVAMFRGDVDPGIAQSFTQG